MGGQALSFWTMGRKQKIQKKKKNCLVHSLVKSGSLCAHWEQGEVTLEGLACPVPPTLAPCFRSEGKQLALLPPLSLGVGKGS